MSTKKIATILVVTAVIGGVVVAIAKGAQAAPAKPRESYKYVCPFGDYYKTNDWDDLIRHIKEAHPEQNIMNIEITWE